MFRSFASPRRWGVRSPRRPRVCILISYLFVLSSIVSLFVVFVVPQLRRLRLRTNLSWYDLGLYGFYPSRTYVTVEYDSPAVEITHWDDRCDASYTFLAPRGDSIAYPGPMILDAQGELIWTKHLLGTTQDFRVQQYQGEYYLTYWNGHEVEGHGRGSWYMVRFSPNDVASVVTRLS